VVVLGLGELGEAVHEGNRLAEVREAEAALEGAVDLVPALGIVGVGLLAHGPESYHLEAIPDRRTVTTPRRLSIALIALLLAGALPTAATAKTYFGVVGPGFTITLENAKGKTVTRVRAGTHTLKVDDRSSSHNFHLRGPGVNRKTGVDFVGKRTWYVTFVPGKYRYVCDPHRSHMRGTFRAANPS
jgi:hypothetical protein